MALALSAACLAGMASFPGGACSSGSYQTTLVVPPRRAPVGIDRIVVQSFTPPGWGSAVADSLRSQIAAEGFVVPVSHGAPAVLSGGVTIDGVRVSRSQSVREREVEQNGRKVKRRVVTHIVRKQANVSVRYSLARAGVVLAGDTYALGYDKSFYGADRATAEANAPPDNQIVGALLRQLAEEVTRDVSPHRVTRELRLRAGRHPGLAQGITYMEHDRLEQALEIWNQVVEIAPEARDKAAAYYNIGVIREARGEYADAFEMFSRADSLTPGDETYIEAMSRVEKDKAARDHLTGAHAAIGAAGSARRLTVRTTPTAATVRIMNIAPRYHPGIALPPGRYDVLIEAPGYAPHRQWLDLRDEDLVLDVRLDAR